MGQAGDDEINGGRGLDFCLQGNGNSEPKNCEGEGRGNGLVVVVKALEGSSEDEFTFSFQGFDLTEDEGGTFTLMEDGVDVKKNDSDTLYATVEPKKKNGIQPMVWEHEKDGWQLDYVTCHDSNWHNDKNEPSEGQINEGRAVYNVDRHETVTCVFGNKPVTYDYGDAIDYQAYDDEGALIEADGYKTLRSNDGARHIIVDGFYMGTGIDPDVDGQPTAAADGDDNDGYDDEDGVVLLSPYLSSGHTAKMEISATSDGYIDAWIDYNVDGDFDDEGEKILDYYQVTPGANYVEIEVPTTAAYMTNTFARFRFSSQGVEKPYGLAYDGEVEDYQFWLAGGYCGDGAVNQTWEQCDSDDGSECTEQCQYVDTQSCSSELTLARVVLERKSFKREDLHSDYDIYLGNSYDPIPNGTWFAVYDNWEYVVDQSMEDGDYANVPGLAVERQADGTIRTMLYGSLDSEGKMKEFAAGHIEFWNSEAEGQRNGEGVNKVEKPFNNTGMNKNNVGNDELDIYEGKSKFSMAVRPANDSFYTDFDANRCGYGLDDGDGHDNDDDDSDNDDNDNDNDQDDDDNSDDDNNQDDDDPVENGITFDGFREGTYNNNETPGDFTDDVFEASSEVLTCGTPSRTADVEFDWTIVGEEIPSCYFYEYASDATFSNMYTSFLTVAKPFPVIGLAPQGVVRITPIYDECVFVNIPDEAAFVDAATKGTPGLCEVPYDPNYAPEEENPDDSLSGGEEDDNGGVDPNDQEPGGNGDPIEQEGETAVNPDDEEENGPVVVTTASSGGGGGGGRRFCANPPMLADITPIKNGVYNSLDEISFRVTKDADQDDITIGVNGSDLENVIIEDLGGTYAVSADVSELGLTGENLINLYAGTKRPLCWKTASYLVNVDENATETDEGAEAQEGDFERGEDGQLFSDEEDAITKLQELGLVNEGDFFAEGPLTRAAASKIILNAMGFDVEGEPVSEKPFPDVEIDTWYAPYMDFLSNRSIIHGYGDGLFRPENSISRAEAYKILYRASGQTIDEDAEAGVCTDIEEGAWYIPYLNNASFDGILIDGNNPICLPHTMITRGEFAELVVQFFNL